IGFTLLASFAVIALAGHMTSTAVTFLGTAFDFQALAISCGALSMITMLPILIVGFIRRGAWLNMNVVEIPIAGFLWTLWIALAVLCTSWVPILFPDGCPAAITATFCAELFAIESLAFVVWILLLVYIFTMIILCLIGKSRGNAVWLVSANT
ncbi:hypothetical protein K435DRAFT_612363, partial [Dendrothele bispora CBS 962.96]